MNRNLMRCCMAYYKDNNTRLAEYLGVSRQTITNKLQGRTDWTRREIEEITRRYNLKPEQVKMIFFCDEVESYYMDAL